MKMKVRELGSFIREQRSSASISIRKLAKLAGVSNPYLSQIERGLRRPSAEILQAIAKALQISAETLYVKAGILDEHVGTDLRQAIMADASLSTKQKDVLLSVYESFRTADRDAEVLAERVEAAATETPVRRKTSASAARAKAPAKPAKAKAG